MTEPDSWTIKQILYDFYEERKKIPDGFPYFELREPLYEKYIQLLNLAYTKYTFGDLFTIESFIIACHEGGFNNYDGNGYYLNWNGEELGVVDCSNPIDCPDDTKFVIWYNK